MARLFSGEKELRRFDVIQLLQIYQFGLSEVEIAGLLSWDRRTANNYLRALEDQGRIYKEGRLWYVEQ